MPAEKPNAEIILEPEETLDPGDWEEFRRLGHRMLDETIDYLATRREEPVWQPMPDSVRESFHKGLPMEPIGMEAAYTEFVERIRPYPNGNNHPRFWGWVQGTGTPLGMMADMRRRRRTIGARRRQSCLGWETARSGACGRTTASEWMLRRCAR